MDILLRNDNDMSSNMEDEMVIKEAASTIEDKISEINSNKTEDKGTYICTLSLFLRILMTINNK